MFSFILVVCLAGVCSLTPIAFYFIWLSVITRRDRPTIISGPWDFAALLAGLSGFILPVATLTLGNVALISRFVRVCVAAALSDPAALAGRARGEGHSEETRRALRRSAAQFAAMAAALAPQVVAGSILIERVFSLPGAGALLAEAVFARDLPTVLALTLLSAVVVVATSVAADIAAAALDPRTVRGDEHAFSGARA